MTTTRIPKLLFKKNICVLQYVTMSRKNINFDDWKIKKSQFHKNKKVTSIDYIDTNKIPVSEKEPYGTENAFK